jgi:hypothetical protein
MKFYRVRMPVNTFCKKNGRGKESKGRGGRRGYLRAGNYRPTEQIREHLELRRSCLALKQHQVHLVYKEPIPGLLKEELEEYFFSNIAAYLHIVDLSAKGQEFFLGEQPVVPGSWSLQARMARRR